MTLLPASQSLARFFCRLLR